MTRSLHLILLTLLLAGHTIAQDNITLAVGYGGRRMITVDAGKTWTHDIAWVEKRCALKHLLRPHSQDLFWLQLAQPLVDLKRWIELGTQ